MFLLLHSSSEQCSSLCGMFGTNWKLLATFLMKHIFFRQYSTCIQLISNWGPFFPLKKLPQLIINMLFNLHVPSCIVLSRIVIQYYLENWFIIFEKCIAWQFIKNRKRAERFWSTHSLIGWSIERECLLLRMHIGGVWIKDAHIP